MPTKSKKAKAEEQKAIEETAQFLGERSEYLSPLIDGLMEVTVTAMKERGFSGIDIAEAMGVACSTALYLYTPQEFQEKIRQESTDIYKLSIETMRKTGIGKNSTMTSQIMAQAKVLSFMGSSAMQSIIQVSKQIEEEQKSE